MNTSQLIALHETNRGQIHGLLGGLTDQHLELCPYPGGHDLRWVLGHLAVSLDFCGSVLGLAPAVPAEWGKQFGPGSSGKTSGGPNLAELVAALDSGHARINEAMAKADAAALAEPHGMDFFNQTPLKTKGDVAALLMTSHAGYHIAQLSALRSAVGLKPLF
ncbi:MAG: DinB family protein [Phycisphaerae bacterium]|nr:DinB family protein [Phycisphaerae bacterium]